jgi:hypothetical protein
MGPSNSNRAVDRWRGGCPREGRDNYLSLRIRGSGSTSGSGGPGSGRCMEGGITLGRSQVPPWVLPSCVGRCRCGFPVSSCSLPSVLHGSNCPPLRSRPADIRKLRRAQVRIGGTIQPHSRELVTFTGADEKGRSRRLMGRVAGVGGGPWRSKCVHRVVRGNNRASSVGPEGEMRPYPQ